MKGQSPDSPVGRLLSNAILLGVALLIGTCCYLVYRLSMLAYRLEQSVVAVSADVKAVTSTVADLSRDVSAIRQDIGNLKQKAQESLPYEEARHAIDEVLAVSAAVKADSSALSPESEREINALLRSLLFSGCKGEVSGKTVSAVTLYGRLYAKYKLRKKNLTSAEDLIEQIGTKTMLGNTYYLIDADGNRVELGAWLTQRLADMRAAKVPQQPDQPGPDSPGAPNPPAQ